MINLLNGIYNKLRAMLKADKIDAESQQLQEKNNELYVQVEKQKKYLTWVPPGHFYSPIPSIDNIKKEEKRIFHHIPENIPGINMNSQYQLEFLSVLANYLEEMPFSHEKKEGVRYYFNNDFYSYCDAITLYCMIRHLKPKKIIEVGSGFSSCVILDTNEMFFNNSISCTFVEPYPERLHSLIDKDKKNNPEIIEKRLQDVKRDIFSELQENDILFIDSTHVSKIDSDVNHLFFKIYPNLNNLVYIHIHDIFYPFEYPKQWIYEGRSWNENYLLRAFLMYNNQFEIVLFPSYLQHFYGDKFYQHMPLCKKNLGGNFWMRKAEGQD